MSIIKHKNLLVAACVLLLSACATTSTGSLPMMAFPAKQEDPFELATKADKAYAIGDWMQAEHYYSALAQRVPNDAYAWSRLGNIKLRQHNFAAAIHAYSKALERNGDDPRTHFNLATAHLLKARESLQQTLDVLPANDQAVDVVEAKLSHFDSLVYGPVVELASPAEGLISTTQ